MPCEPNQHAANKAATDMANVTRLREPSTVSADAVPIRANISDDGSNSKTGASGHWPGIWLLK